MLVFANLAHFSWNDHFQIPDFPTHDIISHTYTHGGALLPTHLSVDTQMDSNLELWVVLRKVGYETSVVPHYGLFGYSPRSATAGACGSSTFNFENLHTESHSGYKSTFPGTGLITWGSDSSPSISLKRSSAPNFKIAVSSSLLKGLEL